LAYRRWFEDGGVPDKDARRYEGEEKGLHGRGIKPQKLIYSLLSLRFEEKEKL
jgi:hypothetical protein